MANVSKHAAIYVAGRLVPALIMVVSTAIFTRLADPNVLSAYVLATSTALLGSAALFQWLRLSVLRYAHGEDRPKVIGAASGIYIFIALVIISGAAIGTTVFETGIDHGLIAASVIVLLCQAAFDFFQELQRGALRPVEYSITLCIKALLSLAFGTAALLVFKSGYALVLALALALVLSPIGYARGLLKDVAWDSSWAKRILAYGWPLSASLVLFNISVLGDRFIVTYFLGAREAGLYGPISDLGRQTITTLLQSVTLASYPLAIRALKDEGISGARRQLAANAKLLLLISVPCAMGLAVAAEDCAFVLLGTEYRDAAATLLPPLALSAFLMSWQMFYFTQSTQLGEKTFGQFIIMVAAAAASLTLAYLLIPKHGLSGAGWAALGGQACGLATSVVVSRFCFPLPFPWRDAAKAVFAGLFMAACVKVTQRLAGHPSELRTIVTLSVGAISYASVVIGLNAGDARTTAMSAAGRLARMISSRR